ncbi:hypothetical protein BST13_14055 [Mycobacterium aquaticum]|uniref:Uncharacterized protein n=1 Tax=Mycobacterium aquaticum TaxID=1927124 RepID=A0A1X0B052_9MYCO|nr:hypothetical protein BST13_14055 [Mycobacterium aquaticum]
MYADSGTAEAPASWQIGGRGRRDAGRRSRCNSALRAHNRALIAHSTLRGWVTMHNRKRLALNNLNRT